MMGDIVDRYENLTPLRPTHSLNLTLTPLRTSHAGTYTCRTAVEDFDVELLGEEQFNVSVKGEN